MRTDRIKTAIAPLASLKLTVALFAMAMVLIFAGTLAQREQGNWEVVTEYFRSFWVSIPLRHLVFYNVPGELPFPGGFVLLGAMLVNLIAAHTTRFQFTWKRSGIVVLHAGLILLLVGELITAAFADEGMMWLREGESASYVEDLREVELAVIEPGAAEGGRDRVTVIPQALLERAAASDEPIALDGLDLTIHVQTWMLNAGLLGPQQMAQAQIPAEQNPADSGTGLRVLAAPMPPVSGVDTNEVNQPAAYVTLSRKGQAIGTFLVATHFANLPMFQPRQDATVGDDRYQIELRYARTYLPYTLHLIEARHDKFVGTEIPRNYSSLLRLDDPAFNEDREVLIYMNNPLRYRGQTFFQAQMGRTADGPGGVAMSGLQVVTNPGWLIPYVSCVLVALGLTGHFGVMLWKFVDRAGRPRKTPEDPAKKTPVAPEAALAGSPSLKRYLTPAVVVVLALVYLGGQMRPEIPAAPYDLRTFAAMPVTAEGRVKPWDTVARSSLLVISGRQTHRGEAERLSAVEWMLDAIARPTLADERPVFRVDHPDVKRLIGVQPGEEERTRFSFNEVIREREALAAQIERAEAVASGNRNAFQSHLLELGGHLNVYGQLRHFLKPYAVPPMDEDQTWQPLAEALVVAHAHAGHDHAADDADHDHAAAVRPATATITDVFRAYQQQDSATFNAAVADYQRQMTELMPGAVRKAKFEVFFSAFAPFYQGTVLYVATFLLGILSVLLGAWDNNRWARRLGVAAVTLLVIAFVVHTFGLGARIWLQGRPPVTNLYSSAVFIGWVSVILALFIERFFRNGLGTILASVIGCATLIIAHNLAASGGGDTMEMMQAVLDSNFWLATHVITVTIGYAAVFVAGAIGVTFLLMGVYTAYLTPHRLKAMGKMMYGTVAFALLFSFVGTVLGGIWADQSWGRFWGWDPKENGAVLIVLMTALILHARWGGMIRERGMAVLAVGGNIITAWSWFGTNMLGVGLHTYGFMDSAMFWLLVFVVSQVAIMSVGLIPMRRWASFATLGDRPAAARTATPSIKPVTS